MVWLSPPPSSSPRSLPRSRGAGLSASCTPSARATSADSAGVRGPIQCMCVLTLMLGPLVHPALQAQEAKGIYPRAEILYMCLISCLMFLLGTMSCLKSKRHATKNYAYTCSFQRVNSDLSPFYSFSVLGPAGP